MQPVSLTNGSRRVETVTRTRTCYDYGALPKGRSPSSHHLPTSPTTPVGRRLKRRAHSARSMATIAAH
jgi:hypothetical protein